MSKILIDRAVLQQALEALEGIATALREEDVLGRDIELLLDAITNLRAALAEPVQELVKQCMAHGECFGGECIYQRPAEPVQEPEPQKENNT